MLFLPRPNRVTLYESATITISEDGWAYLISKSRGWREPIMLFTNPETKDLGVTPEF